MVVVPWSEAQRCSCGVVGGGWCVLVGTGRGFDGLPQQVVQIRDSWLPETPLVPNRRA